MALAATTTVLWGAQCTPPPAPVCEVGESCPAGQIAECAGQCEVAATAGQQCNLDPCSPTFQLCAYDLSCVQGMCVRNVDRPSADVLFCRQRPGTSDRTECPTGTYCHLFGASYPRPPWAPATVLGTCSTPVNEGNVCQGDWAPWTEDDACDAGLRCIADPRDPSRRACFRGCADAANDCACPSSNASVLDECVTNVPESIGAEPGICAQCVANGEGRQPGSWGCCDVEATGSESVCCRPDFEQCTNDADCCPNPVTGARASTCTGEGLCTPCNTEGEAYDPKGPGCCFGEPYPSEGICPVTCFIGPEEVVDGADCCGQGTIVCGPGNTGECVGAPPETLDCDDNDCDGRTDEDFREPDGRILCEAEVPPSANFQGCENLGALVGVINCSTGMPVCAITEGWCAWDRLGNERFNTGAGSAGCFTLGEDCAGVACGAGEWCCNFSAGTPRCSREGLIIAQGASEPVVNSPPPTDCWRPGDLNDDLECPYDEDQECLGLTCASCLETSGCGFCDGTCLPGSSMGPGGGLSCVGSWLYGEASGSACP